MEQWVDNQTPSTRVWVHLECHGQRADSSNDGRDSLIHPGEVDHHLLEVFLHPALHVIHGVVDESGHVAVRVLDAID